MEAGHRAQMEVEPVEVREGLKAWELLRRDILILWSFRIYSGALRLLWHLEFGGIPGGVSGHAFWSWGAGGCDLWKIHVQPRNWDPRVSSVRIYLKETSFIHFQDTAKALKWLALGLCGTAPRQDKNRHQTNTSKAKEIAERNPLTGSSASKRAWELDGSTLGTHNGWPRKRNIFQLFKRSPRTLSAENRLKLLSDWHPGMAVEEDSLSS